MKKMICEVCGGSHLKKVGNSFICTECNTEYSLEDAKKLLQEVDEKPILNKPKKINLSKEPVEEDFKIDVDSDFTENTNASEAETMKLQYDLLCWYNFYQKCHELEDTFEIKDDTYNEDEDITSRQLNWSNSQKDYFENVMVENCYNNYLNKTDIKREYDRKVTSIKSLNNSIDEYNKNVSFIAKCINYIALAILFIIAIVLSINNDGGNLFIGFLVFVACCIGFGIVFFGFSLLSAIIEESCLKPTANKQDIPNLEYYVNDSKAYQNYLNNQKSKYNRLCDTKKMYIYDNIPQLKNIKEELQQSLQIPAKYSDEKHITGMLSLVLNKRANTLKEALNLYETEVYRNSVISGLTELNENIQNLTNQINYLTENVSRSNQMMYQGFNALIQQNNMISNQLAQIEYTTTGTLIEEIID